MRDINRIRKSTREVVEQAIEDAKNGKPWEEGDWRGSDYYKKRGIPCGTKKGRRE